MELIITAFLLGLYGSGHCISMCGPVVGIIGINTQKNHVSSAFLTNLGRITTYSILGIIAAILSIAINDLKPLQMVMRYLAAVLMIFVALQFFGFPKFLGFIEKPLKSLAAPITKLSQKFFPITTPLRAYLSGMVWGLFPCGMVYAAFAISLNASTFIEAPLIMFSFGVGTLAVMVSLSIFGNYAGKWLTSPKLRVAAGILILVMTLFYIVPMLMADLGLKEDAHAHHGSHGDHGMMMDHGQMNHGAMDHSNMDHSQMNHDTMDHSNIDHSQMNHDTMDHSNMDHSQMNHDTMDHSNMDHSQMHH